MPSTRNAIGMHAYAHARIERTRMVRTWWQRARIRAYVVAIRIRVVVFLLTSACF